MNAISSKEQELYEQLRTQIMRGTNKIMNLGQLLDYAASKYPEKIALIYLDRSMTYKELFFRASLFAQKLKTQGIKPRDRVLLFFENSIEFYVGYYAIVQLGAVVAPLNVYLKERELAHIISDAQPRLLIASTALLKKLQEYHIDAAVSVLTESDMDLISPYDEVICKMVPAYLDENEMAALLYTSGTTGLPKGVMLSSKNIFTNCMQAVARLGMVHDERVFGVLPFFHSFAQFTCVWAVFLMGCAVIIVPKIERRHITDALAHEPTIFPGVPALYGLICLMKTADLDSVKLFVSGGDAMPDKIRGAFEMIYQRKIGAGYGLSETSPVLTADLEEYTEDTNNVGAPILGVTISIRDEQGNQVPNGSIGQIWVQGDNVMLGYYNEPQKTAEAIQNGWFDTGDLGYINVHGKLIITGRAKDVIASKGFKIYPPEIENVILMHPNAVRVAVIGQVDPAVGEIVVAYVQLKDKQPDDEQKIRELCERNLAAYKVPRKFILVTHNLPLTGTGKVDKKELRKSTIVD
ncbi:MAG: long-chain-fatty-acid--CoA ligase [Candidatus Babeliales bacterium]